MKIVPSQTVNSCGMCPLMLRDDDDMETPRCYHQAALDEHHDGRSLENEEMQEEGEDPLDIIPDFCPLEDAPPEPHTSAGPNSQP